MCLKIYFPGCDSEVSIYSNMGENIFQYVKMQKSTLKYGCALQVLNENILPPFHAFHDLLPANECKQRHTSSYHML